MALIFKTDDPAGLLDAIRSAIDDGLVRTWQYDDDGDFTHSAEQWKNRAWLVPTIESGQLRFSILNPLNTRISTEVYAVYHGRFIEMVLAHFDNHFTNAAASAYPEASDTV